MIRRPPRSPLFPNTPLFRSPPLERRDRRVHFADAALGTLDSRNRRRHELLDPRSEEHTSELQSRLHLVCRLLLEKKKKQPPRSTPARALTDAPTPTHTCTVP